MKQLFFAEPGRIDWQDDPDPDPGPGQAVVRPLAVSRSDLDIAMAAFGIFPGPFPVGHEIGARVKRIKPGVVDGLGERPGAEVLVVGGEAPRGLRRDGSTHWPSRRLSSIGTERRTAGWNRL